MAEIEADFLGRPLKDRSSFKAPPFIPRRKLKDLGTTTLSGERYFSSEFMKKEWEQVWTCLLYTSPSPRDLSTSRMPSSA